MSHAHVAGKIEFRGKVDSVYIECMKCSHVECVGVWFTKPPKGWSKKHWPKLQAAICLYLDSVLAMNKKCAKKSGAGLMASWSPLLAKPGNKVIYEY